MITQAYNAPKRIFEVVEEEIPERNPPTHPSMGKLLRLKRHQFTYEKATPSLGLKQVIFEEKEDGVIVTMKYEA